MAQYNIAAKSATPTKIASVMTNDFSNGMQASREEKLSHIF
jgi:hypothetical protein